MSRAVRQRMVTTSDGVRLSYLEAGTGPPILIVPGWSQAAAQFTQQLEALSDRSRILAVDMRGHGESDKPETGYSIPGLARDLDELLSALDVHGLTLLGHSMGCAVIWEYWRRCGAARVSKLIFCDQPVFLAGDSAPGEPEPVFTADRVGALCAALAGPRGAEVTRAFTASMVTSTIPAEIFDWMVHLSLRLPRRHAATLLADLCRREWRDVVASIDRPTLVVGGRVSCVPWTSMAWLARQIRGARLEIFEADEGGQHFMFLENPTKFNRLVADFVG